MRAWIGGMVILAGAMPLAASAAGFDCAKASTAVEKAICASPKVSALDGKLAEAYRTALKNHPDKADALKLDQRHWLASRDEVVWAFIGDNPGKPLSATVGQYQERIDFLKGLDVAQVPKPLDVIQAALGKLPSGSSDVLADLAAKGVPVKVATEVSLENAKSFPYVPDKTVHEAVANTDETSSYRVLAGSPVSSVFSIGGTAHCYSETPFRIDGKKAVAVNAPGAWSDDCMSRHELAKIGDDYAALVIGYSSPDEVRIQTSRWEASKFGPDHQLALRFDHALAPTGSACAPKQTPCDEFATTAMTYAARYDRSPLPGTLERALTGADKTTYDALLKAAHAPDGLLPKVIATYQALPDFGTDYASGAMTDYGPEGTLFPLTFHGETLLGYIGHGHVGWRTNDDWMVSAWRLTKGKLEPVASTFIAVKRGSLLLSAPVPAPPPETH